MDSMDIDPDVSELSGDRKACQTCAIAKSKCIFSSDNPAGDAKCERCFRLKKPCNPQPPPVRKRRAPKPSISRGAQMERKLDDIANLLATRSGQNDASSAHSGDSPRDPVPLANNPLPHVWGRRHKPKVQWVPNDDGPEDDVLEKQALPSVKISYQEMEEAIDSWRPKLANHFPFAPVSDSQSTKGLMVEKPFLSTAIAVAALYGDLPRQRDLASNFIKDIANAMLVEGKKSLDLLQGILVLLAWYHYHIFGNPQTSNLIHLAAAMLVDLGLNTPRDRLRAQKAEYFFQRWAHGPSSVKEIRNLAERRALVGCYYLSSVVWTVFKKLDPIPYTDHIHRALKQLEETQELPSDALLVSMVKGQFLLESIERGLDFESSLSLADSAAPAVDFIQTFEYQLDYYVENLPAGLRNHPLLLSIHQCAKLTMYEAGFTYVDAIPASRGSDQVERLQKRGEYLRACVRSIKEALDFFMDKFPPSEFYSQAFDLWARNSLSVVTLARIYLRNDLGDLTEMVKDSLNFETTLERFACAWEEACATARYQGLPLGNNHLFERWAFRLRIFKENNKHVHNPLHLPRANAQATFPGDDPVMPFKANSATPPADPAPAQLIDDAGNLVTIEAPAEGWAPVDMNVQCPMS